MNIKTVLALGLFFSLSVFGASTTNVAYTGSYDIYPLVASSKETLWQAILVERVGGKREQYVKAGRIDVVTETEVYEVDRQGNWKDGMGQALEYATETRKKAVLALMAAAPGPENMQKRTRDHFDFVRSICETNKVRLLILFPLKPEELQEKTRDSSLIWFARETHPSSSFSPITPLKLCSFTALTAKSFKSHQIWPKFSFHAGINGHRLVLYRQSRLYGFDVLKASTAR